MDRVTISFSINSEPQATSDFGIASARGRIQTVSLMATDEFQMTSDPTSPSCPGALPSLFSWAGPICRAKVLNTRSACTNFGKVNGWVEERNPKRALEWLQHELCSLTRRLAGRTTRSTKSAKAWPSRTSSSEKPLPEPNALKRALPTARCFLFQK